MSYVMNTDGAVGARVRARPAAANTVRRWLRQPLLQFLVIGTALFVFSRLIGASNDADARTIIVDSARAERLAELYRVQTGSAPSRADLEYLIDNDIRDEVLYREALRMGLDRDDEIIRRRLIQKMEFLQNDLAAVPEPSEEILQEHFSRHATAFVTPATATFTHIYFSADSIGDDGARRAAERQLADLPMSQGDVGASLGDPFPLQHSYSELTAQDVSQIFGRTPFTDAVFSAPERQWSGPIRSGYGWHLIFVSRRLPSRSMDFEQARDRVRDAYLAEQKRVANEHSYSAARDRYRIVRSIPGRER